MPKILKNPLGNNSEICVSIKQEERKKRYKLQEKIKAILLAHTEEYEHKNIKKCLMSRGFRSSSVGLWKSIEHSSCFYSGLVHCASVWACPVCSVKIMSRRAIEISSAMFYAYTHKQKCIMITFTHPHNLGHKLEETIRRHNQALRYFKSGRAFQNYKLRVNYGGCIRSAEVTYGRNGWHWHSHEVQFVSEDVDIEKEKEFIISRWLWACKKALFQIDDEKAFKEHSIDIMAECHASDYLQKYGEHWGVDKEMVAGSKKNNVNAWELAEHNDLKFLEYYLATKGKAQLFWSRGLKKLIGIKEKTDEELAEEITDKAELICWLNIYAWKLVLEQKARAEILTIAENEGYEGLANWFKNHDVMIHRPNISEV